MRFYENSGASQDTLDFRVVHQLSPPGCSRLGVRAAAPLAPAPHPTFPSGSLSAQLRPSPTISLSLAACRGGIFIGFTGNSWHIAGLQNVIVLQRRKLAGVWGWWPARPGSRGSPRSGPSCIVSFIFRRNLPLSVGFLVVF